MTTTCPDCERARQRKRAVIKWKSNPKLAALVVELEALRDRLIEDAAHDSAKLTQMRNLARERLRPDEASLFSGIAPRRGTAGQFAWRTHPGSGQRGFDA